jgi:hypothetical protein
MPEQYKAFIIIALIAIAVTKFAQPSLTDIVSGAQLKQWRNIWLGVSATAFLLPGFWLFIIAAAVFLYAYAKKHESDVAVLYLLLVCAIPPYGLGIPGLGVINYLFALNYPRLLSLVILLPAFLTLTRDRNTPHPLATMADKLLLLFLTLTVILQLRDTTVTDTLRQAFYAFIDVFLPYFVLSRYLRTAQQFKTAITAFLFAATLSASISIFEFIKHWLLYSSLPPIWQLSANGSYLNRGTSLRAYASYGSPIVFGYGMAVALGLYTYIAFFITNKTGRRNGLLALIAGLLASISRGPWIGALIMFVIFIATGQKAMQRMARLAAIGILLLVLLPVIPGGGKFLNVLPFIGHIDSDTINYRQRLFHNGWIVIQRNPLFGSVNVLKTPEMLSMVQGQGIIDLVNSYLAIALFYGMTGLSLFAGFFVSILARINHARRQFPPESESAVLGRSLLATVAGALIIIATVSSINVIPTVYWTLAGIGMAYSLLQTAPMHNDLQTTLPAT